MLRMCKEIPVSACACMRLRDRSGNQTQKLLKFDDDDDEIPPRLVHNLQGTRY